jgi:hypothetical protein
MTQFRLSGRIRFMALKHSLMDEAFGFHVPDDFVRFIEILWSAAGDDSAKFSRMTDELFFFRPSTELWKAIGVDMERECRYDSTPAMLVPIGDHSVDGAHFGFMISRTRKNDDDVPIAVHNPLDSETRLAGNNFRNALEGSVGSLFKYWEQSPSARENAFAEFGDVTNSVVIKLGLKPVPKERDMGWGTQELWEKSPSFSRICGCRG